MTAPNCGCGTPSATVPVGGQGQSARCSKIFYIAPDCEGIKLDGSGPSGNGAWFSEQVVRIEVDSEVASRRYGHDKSFCAQDSTKGLASWNGRIQTRLQCVNPIYTFHAGDTVWLCIYPLGTSNGGFGVNPPVISGYAEITRDPIIMNLEDGSPVEHNYEYNSKGWWNMPVGVSGTFDCCSCCESVACSGEPEAEGAMEGSIFSPQNEAMFTRALTQKPVTVYQWTDKGEWTLAYDECGGAFMPGPLPQEPGKFVGEMKFIPCMAA